jgi:hypothetical protein
LQATQANAQTKACKRVCLPIRTGTDNQTAEKNNEGITAPTQKAGFRAPQTHFWLIKVWFSASTFVVKIATFAKR